MTAIGTIAGLWRYPVSSVAGELLEEASVGPGGFADDRRFGLVECLTGLPARPELEARWHPALAIAARRADGGGADIRFGDGAWMRAMEPATDAALEHHFGFPVAIRPYANRTPPAGHAGPWAINRYEPNPVHLLTTASQDRLRRLHPAGDPDARRFRPNILVRMAEIEGSFPEAGWIGRRVRVGTLDMVVDRGTRRCGFTIIGQPGLPADADILRHLVRANRHDMGVYCLPGGDGIIRLGETVRLLD